MFRSIQTQTSLTPFAINNHPNPEIRLLISFVFLQHCFDLAVADKFYSFRNKQLSKPRNQTAYFPCFSSALLWSGTGWIRTYGFLVNVSPLKAATYLSFVSSFLCSSPRNSPSLSLLTLPIIWFKYSSHKSSVKFLSHHKTWIQFYLDMYHEALLYFTSSLMLRQYRAG